MKMNKLVCSAILYAVLCLPVLFGGCSDDDVTNPPNPNEQELITTMVIQLRDSATGAVSEFEFDDPDGEGGNPPVRFDTIRMSAGKTNFTNVILLNRSANPVDTVSNEVLEEGVDHQIFFTVSGLSTVISYNDFDANGNPIGLRSIWRNGGPGTGTIQVTLKHQPGIKAPAPGNPNIGETDASVNFRTVIN